MPYKLNTHCNTLCRVTKARDELFDIKDLIKIIGQRTALFHWKAA